MQNSSRVVARKIPFENKITNRGLSLMKQGIGNVLFTEKMYNMALRFYSEAVGLWPDSSGYIIKANCHLQLHEYKEALEDAVKSIELDPKSFQGHRLIATCALALGNLDLAHKYFLLLKELKSNDESDALEINKIDEIYTLFKEADKEFAKGNYTIVVKLMDRILERLPSRKVKLRRAECLALLDQYETADEVASNILILDKRDGDALYVLGLCSYFQGCLDLAIRRFKRVLKVNPNHIKAKELLDKATEIKSKSDEGLKSCESGCYRKSYRLYSDALEVDPTNKIAIMQLHIKRARISFKLCKLNEAIDDCSRALKLNDKCLDALLLRAKLYMSIKSYGMAIKDYETVCSISSCFEYKLLLKHARRSMKHISKKKSFYTILGVRSDATSDEIRCAYRKKSLLHHPDRHACETLEIRKEQELLFKEIGHAYNILIDPQKRSAYDNDFQYD